MSTLIGLEKFNDAKILANKIFLKIKDNPVLLNSIGSIYSHEKNYKLALEFFNKSFTINSNDLSVFLNITSTLSKLDRDDEAIKFTKLIF